MASYARGENSMSKSITVKDVLESILIVLVVVGIIAALPFLMIGFIKYGEWVAHFLGA